MSADAVGVMKRWYYPVAVVVFVTTFALTAATINAVYPTTQSKMEVKTVHRIVYFECGKHKYRVGDNGVKAIGFEKDKPGVWIIEYENGNRTVVVPTETIVLTEEEQNIVVPQIVMADGTVKAE